MYLTHSLSYQQIEKRVRQVTEHSGVISDVQLSHDMTMVITASKDFSAKVPCAVNATVSKCSL